jgi:hypothetical protein
VEYASTRLMSVWAIAIVAANSAVSAPTPATMPIAIGAISSSGCTRTSRYTPAVTIVAACISADTGVGPAIASGNQKYNGNCADLPAAAKNSSSAIAVAASPASRNTGNACAFTSRNESAPNSANTKNIASR